MLDELHAVVIAGGSGTRFWPLSRQQRPKQLLRLDGRQQLLEGTFARVAPLIEPSRWWMVVGEPYAEACAESVPDIPRAQILVEPQARNTAPAIGLAAIQLREADPNAVMAVFPADHHVARPEAFRTALSRAAEVAREGGIVTLGIEPSRPATGYGYIERAGLHGEAATAEPPAYRVARFCEKPSVERAKGFLAQGGYYWNAGIFVMRPDAVLAEMHRQLPDVARRLETVAGLQGVAYRRALNEAFAQIQGISIDYGVMEGARQVFVVPADCGWSDVGSWDALEAMLPSDADGNIQQGRTVALETRNSVLFAAEEGVVATVGVDNLVVVHTRDATLVLPADRAQDVRQIVDALKERQLEQYL